MIKQKDMHLPRKKDTICSMFEDMSKYEITEVIKYGFDYINDTEQLKLFVAYLNDQLNYKS